MKKVLSKQRNVSFLLSPSPMTIDKRAAWGDSESNFQQFPNGGFLKVNVEDNTISHGVQPNADKTAPEGWSKNEDGTYDKLPIFVDESTVYANDEVVSMDTLDGHLEYTAKAPSVKVYNGTDAPNLNDGWLMTLKELQKNYEIVIEYAPAV